jgi:hypothetical protein
MRRVLARASNNPARLLFITEDHDVKTALDAWKHMAVLIRPRKDLFATLSPTALAADSLGRRSAGA